MCDRLEGDVCKTHEECGINGSCGNSNPDGRRYIYKYIAFKTFLASWA